MDHVTSADGTPIAYRIAGSGRPLIFATGAFNDHTTCAELADELAGDFTVVTYDRRARGASGDVRPYRVAREVEDLAALVERAGGSAAVFGFSSGAVLALHAAETVAITHLALYEAPFTFDTPRDPTLPDRLEALVRSGQPGEAVALFQAEGVGLPAPVIEQIRRSPMWPALEAMAQSTVYDATITATFPAPSPAMAALTVPTLVLTGARTWPLLATAAERLAGLLPDARYQTVDGGADHQIPVPATAALLRSFLA